MTFEDIREDEISDLIIKVITASDINKVKEQYKELKLLALDKQQKYWDLIKEKYNTFEEAHCYDILDRCIDFQNANYQVTIKELSNVLKLDDKLKEYCEEHIEKDGIVAALKYKQSIAKKELIKNALKLANNCLHKTNQT